MHLLQSTYRMYSFTRRFVYTSIRYEVSKMPIKKKQKPNQKKIFTCYLETQHCIACPERMENEELYIYKRTMINMRFKRHLVSLYSYLNALLQVIASFQHFNENTTAGSEKAFTIADDLYDDPHFVKSCIYFT